MVIRTRSTLPRRRLSSTILVSHSEEWSLAIQKKGMSRLIHEAKHFILGEQRWQDFIQEFQHLDNRRGLHNNRNRHQHRRYQQLMNLLSVEELKKVSPLIYDSFSLSILQESRRRRRVQKQEQNQLSENHNFYHHSLLPSNNNNNSTSTSNIYVIPMKYKLPSLSSTLSLSMSYSKWYLFVCQSICQFVNHSRFFGWKKRMMIKIVIFT